ncbi:MAG: ABC transporter ATP-binding protein [Nitratireductor sp.]|nr:ABC transporter ATP-binding protein [Nitratireductor sp.]
MSTTKAASKSASKSASGAASATARKASSRASAAPKPATNPNKVFAPWDDANAVPIVEFDNVRKVFGDFTAVAGVSLKIYPREFFALLGPSGCGKTTLLRMLAGFETPTSGRILLDGQDISPVPPNKRPVNMMFQSYALFPHLSVRDNIAFGLKRSGRSKSEIDDRTAEMLQLVQMNEYAGRKPHQLSGGQRQRVALARSLAKNPKLLLLDEPLGALDAKLREQTQFELVNIQEKLGTTFIIVTHDQEEAMTVATRIGLMNRGSLMQVATPSEIYENPNSRFVADFIGDVNMIGGTAGKVTKRDGEEYADVKAEGGVTLRARCGGTIRSGEKCWLAIRPEKIAVSKAKPKSAANLVSGKVLDIAYVGNLSTYHVKLADGTLIKAQSANRERIARREITWEDEVWLSWSPDAAIMLSN